MNLQEPSKKTKKLFDTPEEIRREETILKALEEFGGFLFAAKSPGVFRRKAGTSLLSPEIWPGK